MKRKTTIALILGAVLAAAALIPMAAATQETPPPAKTEKAGIEPARPLADLGLTADQKKALDEFRKARLEERTAFRGEDGQASRGDARPRPGSPSEPSQDRRAHR